MRNRLIAGLVFATFSASMALALGKGPDYVKWPDAKVLSAETGKPICVFTIVGPNGGC